MSTIDVHASSNGRGSPAWHRPWGHFRIDRRSPAYCRVTFDHPPINTITATTVAELSELVGLIEEDADLNVVVFDSANPDFYLTDYDTENNPGGRHAWLHLLVRLSRAPVVSIAAIRGRVRGAGSEFVLACDVRFDSRETALLAQFEVGAGVVPCVNRAIADDKVEALASRLARFDHAAIARTKAYVDQMASD